MMLKKKSKIKLYGVIFCSILLCLSYVGISFYAIPVKAIATDWIPKEETRTLADITYLQEMNKTVCDNSGMGDKNEVVIDIRDNNAYSIAKLSDGKCWMTQNLRLTRESIQSKDPNNTTGKITSENTNMVGSYYEIPASTDRSFSNIQNSDGNYTNQQVRAAENDVYGAYYSYNAATLNKVVTYTNSKATYDICPKGWRLPNGGDSGEFKVLYDQGYTKVGAWESGKVTDGYWLGGDEGDADGAFFPAAGYVYGLDPSYIESVGWAGRYWTNTITAARLAYALYFNNSSIEVDNDNAHYNERYYGYSVRCIANEKVTESQYLSRSSASGSISVKVANTLSIDAVSGMEEEVDSTSIASGTITATIASNTNYKVLLSAGKTSLTSTNTANDAEIPALAQVQAGTNAWGILNSDNTTYSAITNQEKEYYHTTAPSTNPNILGTVHTFNIGISVSPSLPSDTYSTDVTITAAAS